MRKLLTFFAIVLTASFAFAQVSNTRVATPQNENPVGMIPESELQEPDQVIGSSSSQTVPMGTVTSSAVTAIKIGQASNVFTALVATSTQIYHLPGVGTNGGALSFLYRQNTAECGGATADNGKYRVSISLDGGQNWLVTNGNDTSSAGNAFSGCYGKGPVNPTYTRPSRYPSNALFSLSGNTSVDSLAVAYVGPVLQPSASGWDGYVAGAARGLTGTPSVIQEDYISQGGNQYFANSLVTHVYNNNTNFWYISFGWDGTNITQTMFINKGTWNSSTRKIDWTTQKVVNPNYNTQNVDGTWTRVNEARIAFDPTGAHGWVAFLSDLVGGNDSSLNVCFIESTDGGATWGNPFEIDMRQWPEMRDTLQAFWITIDTVYDMNGNIVSIDTLPATYGKPTTGFDLDMVVDANGNPHAIVVVGNGNTRNTPDANYSIFSGLRLDIWDVTKDSYGDWNMLHLWNQSTFRHTYSSVNGDFSVDPFVQASRSEDGNILFFTWTDTDTTGDFGNSDNGAPNLLGRGYRISTNKVTPVVNFTGNDLDWATKALLPFTAPVSVKNGSVYSVPTVITNLDNNDGYLPVSFWYFSDVNFDTDTDFTEDPVFFYNCKQNPFANTVTVNNASCATNNDGSATVNASGGVAPYTYQWDAAAGNATTAGVSSLPAGVYSVTITDDKGCSEVRTVIVNNTGAPTATISSFTDVACFGDSTGAATVTATGGTGNLSYAWSNGETNAAATMLPAGTSTVTVTDGAGCKSFATVTLSQPPAITAVVSGTDIACFGDANGSAAVTLVAGGAGNFSYQWDDPAMSTTASVSGLSGGTYNVTITDGNGCDVTESVTITEPAQLAVTTSFTPEGCSSGGGTATAVGTGGTAPYAYNWSNGNTGSFIFSLNCGCYTVEVTDGNGCVAVSDTIKLGVTSCVATGLSEELTAGINVWEMYPNPNNGAFTMSLELATLTDLRFEVISLNGKVVASRQLNNVLNYSETIDLGNLASGIYMVRLSTDKGSAARKLMIK